MSLWRAHLFYSLACPFHKYLVSCLGHQGLNSLSRWTSYRKIRQSVEAVIFGFKLSQSLWHLRGTSIAPPPRCLSNFGAVRLFQHPISRLRDFTTFGGKTPYRLLLEASFGLRVLLLPASVRQSVRPSFTKFVRAITHHPFKLESPNLDHRCKRP